MNPITRRTFMSCSLASVAAGGAATAAARGAVLRATRAGATGSVLGANERVRFAVIGCGGQGRVDMKTFFRAAPNGVTCPLLCDVDDEQFKHTIYALEQIGQKKPETVKDWRRVIERKDIDAIVLATPDHWHALPLIEAVQAGKDLYCEKPLANSIGEGKVMLDSARRHERVVQVGTQWRASRHVAEAMEYVHSGQLGRIRLVRCWAALSWFKTLGRVEDGEAPPGVDYDMWLGPAPKRPFNRARFHFTFRWFWDYAGGLMTDWGVHLLNIALWGMNVNTPARVVSTGGKYVYDDSAETPDTQCTLYDYGKFTLVWEHQAGTGHGAEGREHGVAFYGTDATLVVDGAGWQVYPESKTRTPATRSAPALERKADADGELCRVELVKNFLDCLRTRRRPVMDIERGYHVSAVAHLGNLALRTRQAVEYDAENRRVIGNEAANRLITNPYRAPWVLPAAV